MRFAYYAYVLCTGPDRTMLPPERVTHVIRDYRHSRGLLMHALPEEANTFLSTGTLVLICFPPLTHDVDGDGGRPMGSLASHASNARKL